MKKEFAVEETSIKGLYEIDYKTVEDDRGDLMEFYRQSDFEASGLPSLGDRPQINVPKTKYGAIRGIHAEHMHKMVSVALGSVFAAIVDLRYESETFGEWQGFTLERGKGLFVSSGLGNSFQTISKEPSLYVYQFSQEWKPGMTGLTCNPFDETLGIDWPIKGDDVTVSEKDRSNPSLASLRLLAEMSTQTPDKGEDQ